jgi:hypothetical protein
MDKETNRNPFVFYLVLGALQIRIKNYVPALTPYIRKYFAFCLKESAETFDTTVIIDTDERKKIHEEDVVYWSFNQDVPLEYNIRKMGHLFVKQIYAVTQTSSQTLLHAAAVGIDGRGILLAARGGGGKSTLAVSAMLGGFRYVSDDYLILRQVGSELTAYPIYSTVNLNPQILNQMPSLQAAYLWDSYWQPAKKTYDIGAHHASFERSLSLKAAVFPKISQAKTPSIEPMKKAKVMVEMIYSTIFQMGDYANREHIRKMTDMVSELDYYRINLSPDLQANVEVLRTFINGL